MTPLPSSRRGWNETAAKFKAAYGIKVQGEDRLRDPKFTGCDRAFAYRTVGDPCRSPSCWDGIFANASRCLEAALEKEYSDLKVGRCVAIASLGGAPTVAEPDAEPWLVADCGALVYFRRNHDPTA